MTALWPDDDFESDLRRLLRHARRASRLGLQAGSKPSEQIIRYGEAGLVIIDAELPVLRSLQRRLTGTSRARSGFSADEAQAVLIQACEEAVSGTVTAAIGSLAATLHMPVEEWVIREPVKMALPVPRLVVGRTTYSNHVPRHISARARQYGFVAPIATTRVLSRGSSTARVLAHQQFALSAAVLDLAAPPSNLGSAVTAWGKGSGPSTNEVLMRLGPLLGSNLVSGTRLVAPYRQLARAAARDEQRRSDWERRLLAAARWFSRGHGSDWPTDRLAAAMIALECLFVVGREERNKGNQIAIRLTERFRVRGMGATEQTDWLRRLYAARNEAVHEGREFSEDLDADRILDLVRSVLVRLAHHLDPSHRSSHRPCKSFDEAMRCSAPGQRKSS